MAQMRLVKNCEMPVFRVGKTPMKSRRSAPDETYVTPAAG
jgi:hypothetical protein